MFSNKLAYKLNVVRNVSWLLGLLLVAISCPTNSIAQDDHCQYATSMQFQCSNYETHCSEMIILKVCSGTGSAQCCTTNGYFTPCCGIPYQNAQNAAPCGSSECSGGGLIADPISGRISKVCFGSIGTNAHAKEPTKANSAPSPGDNTKSRR